MKLVVEDKEAATLSQNFKVVERVVVQTIQYRLAFAGTASIPGTFTFTIKEGTNTVGASSETYASILAKHSLNADTTQHGWYNFDYTPNLILNPNTLYTIEFTSSGYTYDDVTPSYVSWSKPHEDLMPSFTRVTFSDQQKPFGFKIWGLKNA